MKDLVIRGSVYENGKMESGTYSVFEEKFVDPSIKHDLEGTLMRAPINFHTHLGDSFIGSEPVGNLEQIVGPGGFKIRALEHAASSLIRKNMKESIDYMESQGTLAFFDFRESGIRGLKLVPRFRGITGYLLTRPNSLDETDPLLSMSSGFGMSALSDYEFDYLRKLSKQAHKRKKLFALHFSENKRESVEDLKELNPDYVIHCIEATDRDLETLKKLNIPVSITPRSNIFHGKRPDYSRLFEKGLTVTLGTDNAFITEPGIMEEAEFLYRYQRGLSRLSPEQVLSTIIDNPRSVMSKLGLRVGEEKFLFYPNELLTPYQVVTRPNYYDKLVLLKKGNRISFIPRKH